MLKIRLMRIGAKKKPFYRVVAVDERAKRTGGYIELLGTYNPLTEPKEIRLKQDRIDHWIKQGAQLSTGFLRIIGKAPQRLPRKPKKAQPEAPAAPVAKKTEEAAPAKEETPATEPEEVKAETTEAVTEEAVSTEPAKPEPETNEEAVPAEASESSLTEQTETKAEEKEEEKNEGSA